MGSRVSSVNTEKVHLRGGGAGEEGAISGLVSLRAPGKGGLLMGNLDNPFFRASRNYAQDGLFPFFMSLWDVHLICSMPQAFRFS